MDSAASHQNLPDGPVRASELKEYMFQLKQIARSLLAGERNAQSLVPTMLAHSACRRMCVRAGEWREVTWANRQHFFADAIQAMRRALIDRARRGNAGKRPPLEFFRPEDLPENFMRDIDRKPERVELLEEALALLDMERADLARLIGYHYYIGLSTGEIAGIMSVSEKTVDRDLLEARVLLAMHMKRISEAAAATTSQC